MRSILALSRPHDAVDGAAVDDARWKKVGEPLDWRKEDKAVEE